MAKTRVNPDTGMVTIELTPEEKKMKKLESRVKELEKQVDTLTTTSKHLFNLSKSLCKMLGVDINELH